MLIFLPKNHAIYVFYWSERDTLSHPYNSDKKKSLKLATYIESMRIPSNTSYYTNNLHGFSIQENVTLRPTLKNMYTCCFQLYLQSFYQQ